MSNVHQRPLMSARASKNTSVGKTITHLRIVIRARDELEWETGNSFDHIGYKSVITIQLIPYKSMHTMAYQTSRRLGCSALTHQLLVSYFRDNADMPLVFSGTK
jgi:hypothetical protein